MTIPEQPGSNETPNGPEADNAARPTGTSAEWYTWERWRYKGAALFFVFFLVGLGLVVWYVIDQLPKPVGWNVIRTTLRESPGRLADVIAVAGLFAYGVPAGVDLMFGATKAVEEWARKRRAKAKAEGRAQGRAEGREEMVQRLRDLSQTNPELQKVLDELTSGGNSPLNN